MTEPPGTISFEFRGKAVEARAGDTVASALYRSGQRIFTRSFKYHRPRGLLCLSGRCPNCMMNVDGVPNVRACMTPARAGMRVRHQNASPSLERDRLAVAQHVDWLMPVGWYYKTFTHTAAWHAAEPFIRRVAGLGESPPPGSPDRDYEHSYRHTDVAIIGGGPAGMQAAVDLAPRGEQIMLIDDQPALGGHLRYAARSAASAADLIAQVRGLSNVEVMQGCYCFGLYEGNLLGVVQPDPHAAAAERLVHLRAGRVIVATGAYEAPLLFPNNDLVGIMLSSAVQRLVHLHGVAPGRVAVVIGGGRQADLVAADLREGSGAGGSGAAAARDVPVTSPTAATGDGRSAGTNAPFSASHSNRAPACVRRPTSGIR